jgi:hypothetical protein
MTFQVVAIGSDAVRIEMTGMQPGETPAVIVDASSPNASLHAENRTTHPVDANGQFTWEVAGLRFDSPGSLPPSHFNIQVVHAQGTACTSIQLP